MVKVVCPICGVQGYLEKRGNSYRVKHYIGYHNGKRKYQSHYIPPQLYSSLVGINGNQSMGIKTLKIVPNQLNNWAGSSAWNERPTCTREVAGSNPARSTNAETSFCVLLFLMVESRLWRF